MEALPEFRLHRPERLDDVLALKAEDPAARLMAGGTDLLPNMRRGFVEATTVIDLSHVAELRAVEADGEGVHIGAAVTLDDLAAEPLIGRDYQAVAEAAGAVAGPTHRVMGTVGGNLCLDTRCAFYNQSEWWRASNAFCLKYRGERCHVVPTSKRCYAAYSGDLAPALMLYDAEVEIAGPGGRRRAPLDSLYADDGIDYLTLGADELVIAVHLPEPPAGLRSSYAKIRIRGAIDFPLAGVAAAVIPNGAGADALRLCLTGTNSRPVRLAGLETLAGGAIDEAALGEIKKLVQKQISPVRTSMTQPQYRRRAVAALAARLVRDLAA